MPIDTASCEPWWPPFISPEPVHHSGYDGGDGPEKYSPQKTFQKHPENNLYVRTLTGRQALKADNIFMVKLLTLYAAKLQHDNYFLTSSCGNCIFW